jgi:hypothetical protein
LPERKYSSEPSRFQTGSDPPPVTPDSFANYLSPYNGLRVAKGFVWLLLLLWPLQRAIEQDANARELLCAGFLVGLLGVSLIGLYERSLFAGALTWDTDYRISSSFSSMHAGDGPIDVWLTTTIPLLGIFVIDRRWRLYLPLAFALGLLSLYTLVATGSRGPAIGVAIAYATGFLALAATHAFPRRIIAMAVVGVTALSFVAAAGLPVLAQTALGQRFLHAPKDAATRFDHWRVALDMRDNTVRSQLFGMGLGSFPRIFQENAPIRSGRYTFIDDGSDIFLRLWSGLNLYMGQVVTIRPNRDYQVVVRFRTREPSAALRISACELWLLESRNCTVSSLNLPPADRWQTLNSPFHTTETGSEISIAGILVRRPTWFTFYVLGATAGGVDIGAVSLTNSDGQELIRNADFREGADHWFWVHDDHSSWHTLNLVVDVLFNQGWFGLLALGALLWSTVVALARRIAGGDPLSAVLLAALTGFAVTGVTVSALDQPRLILAFCLICFAVLCRTQQDSRARVEIFTPVKVTLTHRT